MKLREYFVRKENKYKRLYSTISSPPSHCPPPLMRVSGHMHMLSSARKQGAAHACSMSAASHACIVVLSITAEDADLKEKNLLNNRYFSFLCAQKVFS